MGGNMGKNIRSYLCLLAFLLSFSTLPCVIANAAPALKDEKITNFKVIIHIGKNGDADITEEITVNALNIQIRHGIFREIPKYYLDGEGNKIPLILQFGSITQDGKGAKFKRTDDSNYYRLQIGDPHSYVMRGTHRYFINYRVKNSIWRGADHDEFYWNVTGNGWPFYIDEATVRLNFPDGVNILGSAVYTGKDGSQAVDANADYKDKHFSAYTTRMLAPREGMTIAVAIPKNSIGESSKFYLIVAALGYWVYYALFLMIIISYIAITWFLFGREKPGVIIPRFEPPANMSPDDVCYIVNQGYNDKTFATYIIAAASAGAINIKEDEEHKLTILTKNQNFLTPQPKENEKSQNFQDILSSLFSDTNAYILKKRVDRNDPNLKPLRSLKKIHRARLGSDLKYYINGNNLFCFIAMAIAAVFCLIVFVLDSNRDDAKSIIMITFNSMMFLFILYKWGIKRYTWEGQALADEAAGFKMFLNATEEARLNVLYPKHITPQMFEKYLPYAYALGVDQEWCEQFAKQVDIEDQLKGSSLTGLMWISHHHGSLDITALSSSLQSIGDVISASSVSPRSSGSGAAGGRGFSGRGGGGGGGGGW